MEGSFTGRNALLIGVLLASYPALLAAALWPATWAFAVAAALSYAAEAGLRKAVRDRLGRIHLGSMLRYTARELAVVVLLARVAGTESRGFLLFAGGLFALHCVCVAQTALATYLNSCHHLMPVTAANLDLSALRIPPAPPARLVAWRGTRLLPLDALPVGLAAFGALSATPWPGVAGAAAAVLVVLAAALTLVPHVRRATHLRDRAQVIQAVDEQVRAYAPEVLLYFSGSVKSVYQATMWLETLERIGRRTVVVLRQRSLPAVLGPTTLPVVCIPSAVDLMNFRGLDSAGVALFAANVGNNIHLLRKPGVTSVFIGHGDSDKEASFNPFTKVYDEVWVAGPAGRERYRHAEVGVRDEAIVEVGRPQLAAVLRGSPYTRGTLPVPTVLYAPTWEGWTTDLFHTSIDLMGPRLVRALLNEPVRLIYRPHPLTGHRSAAARAAHRKIMAQLRDAHADGPWAHVAVTGGGPDLYECFNQADLLIGDISSVVSDFVASGKPYVVTNVAGLPDDEFRARCPSARAAYLLGHDLGGLTGVLASLREGEDTMAAARRELRAHLLGPDEPDALTRFDEAVGRAVARSRAGRAVGTGGASVLEQVLQARPLGLGPGLAEPGRAGEEAGAP
ncbi:hypothetical protein Psi02_60690 [Planotetraspora silvatica]|uniref:CDP-Glycerol:Poly(Glycerophosphate) glycerophosphotransferase n=1 Tax=Planotetraspora silvatica TaxID=234614 RepID=A0A8J3URY4_9ACTN|nr:CDP-glycerol glycerophosphotransferase family protein [Planotetraspora silvatica]GII49645.1 hypothetical protein Psi02_60690 [Planotetraspora silvatica]